VGLHALALTDHDTVAGIHSLTEAARSRPLEVIPGVEISCEDESGRYHVLGYGVNPESSSLVRRLEHFQRSRRERVRGMIEVLASDFDVELSFEAVRNQAGRNLMGKPHVAQALVEKNVVDSFREAFERFLGKGKPLDEVPKERMSVEEALRRIDASGGVPVLAHPVHYGLREGDGVLARFVEQGIRGIEVHYPDHDEAQRERYRRLAERHDLLITGGTDFHGEAKPEVELGDVRLPSKHLERLQGATPAA